DKRANKAPVKDPLDFAGSLTDYRVGSFGKIHQKRVKVVKVVDESSAVIVVLPASTTPPGKGTSAPAPIRVLVSGIDTKGMADNTPTDAPAGAFYVVGNKKVGDVTYLHLAPLKFTAEELAHLKGEKP